MNLLIIKNGTIMTHDKTIYNMDVLIKEGKIAEIDTNIKIDNCNIIDAKDKIIIPGLVDMHCEIGEPGYEYKENLETAGYAAARGGFTSITCSPNTSPVIDNKTVVEYILSKSKSECTVNVFPYGSITLGCSGKELSELGEMQIAGVVALSDGDNSVQDAKVIRKTFQYASMLEIPIIIHSEDISLSNNCGINESYIATTLGLRGAPITAETTMLTRNILLAEEFDVHLHVTHLSTKRSVEIVRMAKKKGIRITAETSPQYFILDEGSVNNYNTFAKVNPPLRSKDDIEGILIGIKDGTIDVISSDHKPNTIDSKCVEFDEAAFGISSLESAFSLAYTHLVDNKIITLEKLIEKMSFNPSRILGINKGRIAVGVDADLIVIDPYEKYTIDSKEFLSKAKYSPFDGTTVNVKICNTIIKGKNFII